MHRGDLADVDGDEDDAGEGAAIVEIGNVGELTSEAIKRFDYDYIEERDQALLQNDCLRHLLGQLQRRRTGRCERNGVAGREVNLALPHQCGSE